MPSDPRQADQIATTTRRWMQANVPGAAKAGWEGPLVAAERGMTTFIWFGRLRGGDLPAPYRQPLALRVFGSVGEDETLMREESILRFVAASGFPAPLPLVAVPTGSENPVGLPWMVLPHVPGDPLLAVISRAPWAAPRRLRELAALQVRLHELRVAGCPLPAEGALADRWLDRHDEEIRSLRSARADAVLDRLEQCAGIVRDEQPVVCHGDFHPLNVLSERQGSRWSHVVIDWTDAVVGDRHFDVARTLALFRVASVVATSTAERIGLRIAAPVLTRIYQRRYERDVPLDRGRLAYWTAAHFLHGWWQITQLHRAAFDQTRADIDAVPASLADEVLTYAEQSLSSLERP